MNRLDIATKIRDNISDAGITYYSKSDINESIQDGYDEVAVYSECIERWTVLPQVVDTTYYDFSTIIPDYYRIISIWGMEYKMFMEPVVDRDLVSYQQDWELASYGSREFMILGPNYVGISGRRSSIGSENQYRIYYKAQANKMTLDTDIPRININYHNLLELYGTADMLDQNQEYGKAAGYWNQYNDKLEKYKQKIQLLAKGDRVFTREGYISYGY